MSEPEFYPMPLFVTLMVSDVTASADWYEQTLGFRSVYALPGPNGTQTMNHIRLERYQDLMLVGEPPDLAASNKGQGVVIRLTYYGDLDGLARQARSTGANVTGPSTTPWNTREVTVQDPDGYILTFSQVLDATRDFEDVMSNMREG